MHQTALTRRCRKQFLYGCQQSVMAVCHDQIDLNGSSSAQIMQKARPSIFVLLSAGSQC